MHLSVVDNMKSYKNSSEDMRFACAIAALGMHLFDSKHKGDITIKKIKEWVKDADGFDPNGYKEELIELIDLID